MSDRDILNDILAITNRMEDKIDRDLDDIRKDIAELKTFQNRALGILSVFTAFVSVIATYIWNKIMNNY